MPQPSLVQEYKDKVWHLLVQRPFVPFRIVLDAGDKLNVGHPENFAMWPGPESNSFQMSADGGRSVYAHFSKMTAVEIQDPQS